MIRSHFTWTVFKRPGGDAGNTEFQALPVLSCFKDFWNDRDSVRSVLDGFENDLNCFESDLSRFGNALNRFRNALGGFENDLKGFRSELNSFENDLKGFKNDLSGFENDLNGFENDLNGFENDLNCTGNETEKGRDSEYSIYPTVNQDVLHLVRGSLFKILKLKLDAFLASL